MSDPFGDQAGASFPVNQMTVWLVRPAAGNSASNAPAAPSASAALIVTSILDQADAALDLSHARLGHRNHDLRLHHGWACTPCGPRAGPDAYLAYGRDRSRRLLGRGEYRCGRLGLGREDRDLALCLSHRDPARSR